MLLKVLLVSLLELLCANDELNNHEYNIEIKNRCEMFSTAMSSFQAENWQQAKSQFSELLLQYTNDKPAQFYLQYCDLLENNELPYEWNGIIELNV